MLIDSMGLKEFHVYSLYLGNLIKLNAVAVYGILITTLINSVFKN